MIFSKKADPTINLIKLSASPTFFFIVLSLNIKYLFKLFLKNRILCKKNFIIDYFFWLSEIVLNLK